MSFVQNYAVESFNTYSMNTKILFSGNQLECRKYLLECADKYDSNFIESQTIDGFVYETEKVSIYYSIVKDFGNTLKKHFESKDKEDVY